MYTRLWLDEMIEDNGTEVLLQGVSADSPVIKNAVRELTGAASFKDQNVILALGKEADPGTGGSALSAPRCQDEGFYIERSSLGFKITAQSERGLLYGAFRLINLFRLKKTGEGLCLFETPKSPLRMLNHWDNMDGSIERGYSGDSFFFENDDIVINERTRDYARLIASMGINGIVINNVNVRGAACDLINERFISKVRKLQLLFEAYGVTLYLSLNYAAPVDDPSVGSADPLDQKVIDWWKRKFDHVYSVLPGFGGFLVKADSEGRPGPFTYGRNQAEGANMLADAIRPHGGRIIWRCFVYNCKQDWRDLKTDRARAAYDYFKPLDGQFADNVILQIKNGPMDFQVREPVSPLFGQMPGTNQMIEFQIAQEYTGQQRHVCYLIPWFKEVLDFDACVRKGQKTDVSDIVCGRAFPYSDCGICAVTNTGNDANWTGHDLAAANLYGFGRLAFDPSLSSEDIAREWIGLTYGTDQKVVENILKILMMSWPAYEKYTAPLGIGWMVVPNTHYGPDPDGYEYSKWGTYHKATCREIGVERNSTGTGYVGLYEEPLSRLYEKAETTPDELKLFFHRLPYDYVLSSGKTVIQHIYDTHFEGVSDVEEMVSLWKKLEGRIGEGAFKRVEARFAHQLEHAKEWRDVINSYFYRKTMIEDEHGRELY